MSEYWVSKKKYFCKYCDIYIADDAPSRQQHENGLRHKGNKDRFIRGLYKAGEKQKKDQDEEKREMARVERAAQAAFAQDVGAGRAQASSSTPGASTSAAKKPPVKPTNPFTNYSTPQSLGYKDDDVEILAADAQRRRAQGVAGDWEVVAPSPVPTTSDPTSEKDTPDEIGFKREGEPLLDDSREFKLRKKSLGAGFGETYDPGLIPIKLKAKDEPAPIEEPVTESHTSSVAEPTGVPKWTRVQWRRPGDVAKPEEIASTTDSSGSGQIKAEVKAEDEDITPGGEGVSPPVLVKDELRVEDDIPTPLHEASSSIFRKRKAPAGGSRGRRQV